MDIYHVWFDLKPGTSDLTFVEHAGAYLEHLSRAGKIASYRIMRRKLGFSPPGLGEFHITIETADLAQLEAAFQHVASRAGEVEGLHAAMNQLVDGARFALYRDFPDAVRKSGQERF